MSGGTRKYLFILSSLHRPLIEVEGSLARMVLLPGASAVRDCWGVGFESTATETTDRSSKGGPGVGQVCMYREGESPSHTHRSWSVGSRTSVKSLEPEIAGVFFTGADVCRAKS